MIRLTGLKGVAILNRYPNFNDVFNKKKSKSKSTLVRIDQEFKQYLEEAYGIWFRKNNDSFREFTRQLAKKMPRPKELDKI